MKRATRIGPTAADTSPLLIESRPRLGPMVLFDDSQRNRQRAGAQKNGEIVGLLNGKVAGDFP
jgi:hypothetical protein